MKKTRDMRAFKARCTGGLLACGLIVLVAQGCAESIPIEFVMEPDGGSPATGTGGTGDSTGTGGDTGTGGGSATGGSFGTGGGVGTGGTPATGGVSGTGGFKATGGTTGTGGAGTGGNHATGGAGGAGGARATGGASGGGGMRATGGTTGTGGTGAGGAAGSAATFTQVYQMVISVSCTGSQCHNPGSQSGVSFSSQSNAYSAVKSRVVAGNATGSSFYTTVNTGRMPPGGKLSSSQLSMIAAWINAGALNN